MTRRSWVPIFLTAILLMAGCGSEPEKPRPTAVVNISQATFEKEVTQQPGLVVLDFFAVWCGPCKAIAPHLDDLSVELRDKVKFTKIDVDNNKEIAQKSNLEGVPTLLLFKDGKEIDRRVGQSNKEDLKSWLDKHLK